MKKEFDRYLAELQTKMVAVCMEYVIVRMTSTYTLLMSLKCTHSTSSIELMIR